MSRLSQLVNDYTPLTFWTWPTRKLAGEPSYERSNHVEHRRTQWSILDIISLITCLSPVVLFCRKAPNYAIVGPASCGACAGCVRLWLNIILSHELNALRSCDAWLMTTREYARVHESKSGAILQLYKRSLCNQISHSDLSQHNYFRVNNCGICFLMSGH